MFISRLLAFVVLPYMALLVPVNRMFEARMGNDHVKMTRWASFLTCTLAIVVPVAWMIPAWVVGRYDILWTMLYLLSVSDAAVAEYIVARLFYPHIVSPLRLISSMIMVLFRPTPVVSSPDTSDDEGDEDSKKGQ